MNAIPFLLILALALVLVGLDGGLSPSVLVSIGGFAVIVVLGTFWNQRRQAAGMKKLTDRADLTQYFQSQLQDEVHGYVAADCTVADLGRPPIPIGHRSFNAFVMWLAQAGGFVGNRVRHIKGAKGSLARALPHDDGYIFLVLGTQGLSMWRITHEAQGDSPPTFLRTIARGSQLADVTVRTGGARFLGRYIVRLSFTDGSRIDYWGYDLDRAAAFDHRAVHAPAR